MALLHNYTKEELEKMAEAFEDDKKAFLEGSYTTIYNNSMRTKVVHSFLTREEREADFNINMEFFMLEFFKDEEKPYLENSQFYGYDVKATRLCQYFIRTVTAINDKHFKELDSVKAIVEEAHNLINKAIELAFYRFNNELENQRNLLEFAKENKEKLIEKERKNIFKATGGKPETFNETPEEAYIAKWIKPIEENIATISSGNAGSVQLEFLLPCPQNTIFGNRYKPYDGDTTETEPQGYLINLQDMRKLLKDHILYRHFKALEELAPDKAEQLESYLNIVLRKSSMIKHETYTTQAKGSNITNIPERLYIPTAPGTRKSLHIVKISSAKEEKAFLGQKREPAESFMEYNEKTGHYDFGLQGFQSLEFYVYSDNPQAEIEKKIDSALSYVIYAAVAEKYGSLSLEELTRQGSPAIIRISYRELVNKLGLNRNVWTPTRITSLIQNEYANLIGIIKTGNSPRDYDLIPFLSVDRYKGEKDTFYINVEYFKALITLQRGIRINEARNKLAQEKKKNTTPEKELTINPIASLNIRSNIAKAKDKIAIELLYRLDQIIATTGERKPPHKKALELLKDCSYAYDEYLKAPNKTKFIQRHFENLLDYAYEFSVYWEKYENFRIIAYSKDKAGNKKTVVYDPAKSYKEQRDVTPNQRNIETFVYEIRHAEIDAVEEEKRAGKKKTSKKKRR